MIKVYKGGKLVASYDPALYYADPAGGKLNIRLLTTHAITATYQIGQWTDVK
jgi:hypothetical protein